MKIESFLRWLAILLFTALAVWVTIPLLAMIQTPALRRINPFFWWLVVDVILWFIIVRFLFQDFYVRGRLYGDVKQFYERVLEHPFQRVYKYVSRGLHSLSGRIVLSAFVVLSIIGLVAATGAWDNFSFMLMRTYLFSSPRQFHPLSPQSPENHVTVLQITTPDNNRDRYLDACLKTAHDLKATGARVMMMEIPWLPATDENLKKVDELNKTSIVVFGTRFSGFGPQRMKTIYTQHPLLGKLNLLWGQITYPENISYRYPAVTQLFMNPFIPYGTIDVRTNKTVPDVALEVLKKYTDASEIRREENEIVVGDIRLPISNDGELLSYNEGGAFPLYSFVMTLNAGDKSSSPMYKVFKEGGMEVTYKDLTELEELFVNKIVIIKWDELNNPNLQTWADAGAYSTFINNALNGTNLIRKAEGWPTIITLLSVLFCGFFSRSLRGLHAVPLMLLHGAALFFGGAWLLQSQQILLDTSYPLAAVILSIAVFPLVRFAWTMRAAEATPTSGGLTPSFTFSTSSQKSMAPSPVQAPPQQARKLLALTSNRLSLSFPIALLAIALAITGSAAATYVWLNATLKPRTEVIYVPTLPTVEVQGYYSKSGN